MNRLVQELIRPFLGEVESKYDLVVYGGGFKPPTSGHLSTALRAYQIPAKKHQIVVGGGVRDKITSDSSIKIWQLYQNKEGLPTDIEILQAPSPVKYTLDLAKDNPDLKIAFIAGVRDEEDLANAEKLKSTFDKAGIKIETIADSDSIVSGTKVRRAFLSKDKDTFLKLMPPNSGEEIWNILTRALIPEIQEAKSKMGYRAGAFNPSQPAERLKDKGIGIVKSKVGLLGTGHYFMGNLDDVKRLQDQLGYTTLSQIDLSQYRLFRPDDPTGFYENIKAVTSYLHGLKPEDLQDSNVKDDIKDAADGFAEYIGLDKKEALNIFKEYIKDVMSRKDGDLLSNRLLKDYDGIDLTNTPYDDFGTGSLIFNGKLKKGTYSELEPIEEKVYFKPEPNISSLQEGRYDAEVTSQSRYIINQFKTNFGVKYEEETGGNIESLEYTLEFKFIPSKKLGPIPFIVEGEADYDTAAITIKYNPTVFPKEYNNLIAEVKETLRHELEHIAQLNFEKGIRVGDQSQDKISLAQYLVLDYEVPAFVQGLYKRAKTKKISLQQAIDEFFDERDGELTDKEETNVRKVWDRWIRLNLPQIKLNEGVKDLRPKIDSILKKHKLTAKELQNLLKKGTKVEKEHTSDPVVAMKIALDHIDENPEYYNILAKVGLEEEGKAAPYGSGYKPLKEELEPLILDFTSFLVANGMKLHPFPKIKFIEDDVENANNPLGKTAYYDPQAKCIALYTLNRHPKDILRSYSHELVHHMQNIEDRLKPMDTSNVYEDEELADIEKEAHELGSMNLRKWEDSLKTNLEEELTPEYKIYSDMDGVITDFDSQFEKLSDGISPSEYEKKNGKETFWKLIRDKGVGFWVGMPWMSDGLEYWNYIEQYNPTLLSAPSKDKSSRLGKHLWVKNNIPGTKLVLAYAQDKQKYAAPNHILIDDRLSNIEQWRSQGGIGILHTSAANTIQQLKELGL